MKLFGFTINKDQKKIFVDFFQNIAIAWFVAIFATPNFAPQTPVLTIAAYGVNMVLAIGIALYLERTAKA